ncbi:hypothetical protein [Microbacterium sp. SS28]|uniref:hypothetical protein n=1 Tax=Microbacterium sp. SS28 TaxID=2919948 RepID=UPI001FAB2FC0|nr:hypothetical protein [Microbacterium sp. SS28]
MSVEPDQPIDLSSADPESRPALGAVDASPPPVDEPIAPSTPPGITSAHPASHPFAPLPVAPPVVRSLLLQRRIEPAIAPLSRASSPGRAGSPAGPAVPARVVAPGTVLMDEPRAMLDPQRTSLPAPPRDLQRLPDAPSDTHHLPDAQRGIQRLPDPPHPLSPGPALDHSSQGSAHPRSLQASPAGSWGLAAPRAAALGPAASAPAAEVQRATASVPSFAGAAALPTIERILATNAARVSAERAEATPDQPVQRAEELEAPPPEAPPEAPPASAPAPGAAPAAAAPGLDIPEQPAQVEKLVDRIYAPIVRRLKAELLLDRERRGVRIDRI